MITAPASLAADWSAVDLLAADLLALICWLGSVGLAPALGFGSGSVGVGSVGSVFHSLQYRKRLALRLLCSYAFPLCPPDTELPYCWCSPRNRLFHPGHRFRKFRLILRIRQFHLVGQLHRMIDRYQHIDLPHKAFAVSFSLYRSSRPGDSIDNSRP